MPFDERPPPPPAPDVQRVDRDGRPTTAWLDWEKRLVAWCDRLSSRFRFASPFTPAEATIAAAGANGRVIATMVAPAAMTPPMTWAIVANPAILAVKFVGAQLQSSANPIGPTGTYFLEVQGTDSASHVAVGDLKITLT